MGLRNPWALELFQSLKHAEISGGNRPRFRDKFVVFSPQIGPATPEIYHMHLEVSEHSLDTLKVPHFVSFGPLKANEPVELLDPFCQNQPVPEKLVEEFEVSLNLDDS